jgi:NAD(P)-dependent dehydrogenase (short-subunit alcohol dehydrogenase family)
VLPAFRKTGFRRRVRPDPIGDLIMTTSKIALITGGSRGLGRNTAIAAAKKGVDIVLTYHSNATEAAATVAAIEALGRKAVALQLDTGVVAQFDSFVGILRQKLSETFGRDNFDYLVNNAGTGLHAPFAETKEADFDRLVDIHFKGVFFLTQKLLPVIVDGGRIVNLSSGLARFSLPGMSAYAAMKGAVEVLTRYLAKELGARGITVNTVAPGAIETDFGGGAVRDNPDFNRMVASATALGRAGLPDDIGPMIASLLSDDNRWVNGQRIEVSGGVYL